MTRRTARCFSTSTARCRASCRIRVTARPLPGVPSLLTDLAARFALVAVISGRPTAFLAEVLGEPPGVTLAGLYGLERALRGPDHDAWAAVIDAVVAEAGVQAPARRLRGAQGTHGDAALAAGPRARRVGRRLRRAPAGRPRAHGCSGPARARAPPTAPRGQGHRGARTRARARRRRRAGWRPGAVAASRRVRRRRR